MSKNEEFVCLVTHWTRTNGIDMHLLLLLCWDAYTRTHTHTHMHTRIWWLYELMWPIILRTTQKKLTKTKLRIAFLQSQIMVKSARLCVFGSVFLLLLGVIGAFAVAGWCARASASMSEHPSHIHLARAPSLPLFHFSMLFSFHFNICG